jgi:hypothetical protein
MVIRSDNATLNADGQRGYIQVNATAIKIPFSFQSGGVQTKLMYFTVDANVSSFSFYPTVERINNSPIIIWVYLNEIRGTYNQTTHSYLMGDSFPMGPQ